MTRVLMVTPPLFGHVNPLMALAESLEHRGCEIAWVGHPRFLSAAVGTSRPIFPRHWSTERDETFEQLRRHGHDLRGAAALGFLYRDFFWPLAHRMVPDVHEAIESFQPDLLIVDQQAMAGAVVAQLRGLPWVTSASTSATLANPLSALPQLETWMEDGHTAIQSTYHLPPLPGMCSPHGVLVFSTEALMGGGPYPPHWHLVGPTLRTRPPVEFPWDRLDPSHPTILVSLGTVSRDRGRRFFGALSEALEARPLRAVVVARPEILPKWPSNCIVRPFVPQLALLPHMDAVVCHAGHNTVVEALAHGLPLVVAPIRDDQPIVAHQVVTAGVGIRVKFGRVRADKLGQAMDRVLEDPRFRANAQRVRRSFEQGGGARAAADHVLRVAARSGMDLAGPSAGAHRSGQRVGEPIDPAS